jgi:hypothetical protein
VLSFRRSSLPASEPSFTASCRGLVYTIDDDRIGLWKAFVYRVNHDDPDPPILGRFPSYDIAVDICNQHATGRLDP